MNINSFDKFNFKINIKQFWYVFLIISFSLLIIFLLFYLKNKTVLSYDGIVLNSNVFEISNLKYEDVKIILDSNLKLLDRKINRENIEIEKNQDKYQVKIILKEIFIPGDTLKLDCIYEEESLFQFIKNIMKGEN